MRLRPVLFAVAAAALGAPATAGADELLGTCGSELCVAAPGGAPAPVTTDGTGPTGPYSSVSASADGQRITYTRPAGLWRAGPRNAAPELVLEVEAGDARESAISADGQSFAFRTFETQTSSLRIGGAVGSFLWQGTRVRLPGFLGNDVVITQSADGQPNDVACRVAAIPSESPPPCGQIVAADPTREVQGFDGSSDGKLLVAEAQSTDFSVSEIAVYDTATGGLVRTLTAGGRDFAPSFSPDGTRVAFTRDGATFVVPVAGGEPTLSVPGMVGANWYEPPAAPPPPGGQTTPPPATPGAAGRPLGPKGRLAVRKGRLGLKVRCAATAACARTTWKLRQGKRTRLTVRVPALAAGARRTLRVTVPKATLRRIGRKGLKLRLSGPGLKPRTVTLVKR